MIDPFRVSELVRNSRWEKKESDESHLSSSDVLQAAFFSLLGDRIPRPDNWGQLLKHGDECTGCHLRVQVVIHIIVRNKGIDREFIVVLDKTLKSYMNLA